MRSSGSQVCGLRKNSMTILQLPCVDENSVPLVVMAAKLMEGKCSGIHTDDPDTVRRCRLLARHIGASVEMIEEEAGHTRIFFSPPRQQ